jgi:hypothetical protein
MPPLEMRLIVAPLFRGKDLRICEAIMSYIAISLMNPQTKHLLFFALKDDTRDYLQHYRVFGQKT